MCKMDPLSLRFLRIALRGFAHTLGSIGILTFLDEGADTWRRIADAVVQLANDTPAGALH